MLFNFFHLRSNNTYYPLRKGRTIARQKNEQSRDLSKNQIFPQVREEEENNLPQMKSLFFICLAKFDTHSLIVGGLPLRG